MQATLLAGRILRRHTAHQLYPPCSHVYRFSSLSSLLFHHKSPFFLSQARSFSCSLTGRAEVASAITPIPDATQSVAGKQENALDVYKGPLDATFRRLKILSLATFSLTSALAPFMFLVESSLPLSARLALASIAMGTSGLSTALVGWCGKPYVTTLRRLDPEENGGAEGLEMTTLTLALNPRVTRVYDPSFLIETRRPFAKWELAKTLVIPEKKNALDARNMVPDIEETVAETMDKNGVVVGRWIVKWSENGEGTCHEVGNVMQYFNVHEELLR